MWRRLSRPWVQFPLAVMLAIAGTVGLALLSETISRRTVEPENLKQAYLTAYLLLPGMLPVAVAVSVLFLAPRARSAGVGLLTGAVLSYLFVMLIIWGYASPLGPRLHLFGPPDANLTLWLAASRPTGTDDAPLHRRTAEWLNSIHHGSDRLRDRGGGEITYVGATVPSTGPLIVSVNPMDEFTWGAAALALNGRCFITVIVLDRADPQYGGIRDGVLPAGAPCMGALATPANAATPDW